MGDNRESAVLVFFFLIIWINFFVTKEICAFYKSCKQYWSYKVRSKSSSNFHFTMQQHHYLRTCFVSLLKSFLIVYLSITLFKSIKIFMHTGRRSALWYLFIFLYLLSTPVWGFRIEAICSISLYVYVSVNQKGLYLYKLKRIQ